MVPRLNSSKKWTALPPELVEQVRTVFEEAFEKQKMQGAFKVEGRIYSHELLFRVGFAEAGRLKQANFEVSIDFNPAKQNALELIHLAIDCAASMLEEHFSNEEAFEEMPTAWKPVEIEGRRLHVQVSTVNSTLEAEADRLLGESGEDALVVGDDGEEVEEAVKKMLGLEGDLGSSDDDGSESDAEPEDGRNRKDH